MSETSAIISPYEAAANPAIGNLLTVEIGDHLQQELGKRGLRVVILDNYLRGGRMELDKVEPPLPRVPIHVMVDANPVKRGDDEPRLLEVDRVEPGETEGEIDLAIDATPKPSILDDFRASAGFWLGMRVLADLSDQEDFEKLQADFDATEEKIDKLRTGIILSRFGTGGVALENLANSGTKIGLAVSGFVCMANTGLSLTARFMVDHHPKNLAEFAASPHREQAKTMGREYPLVHYYSVVTNE